MTEGVTCYERDETLCEDQMCLRVGCKLRNERLATPVRCARCGSSGDVFMLCAGCQSPLASPPPSGVREALKFTEPPFGVYHNDIEIGDKNGHVCTAENPDIAKDIVAALTTLSQFPATDEAGREAIAQVVATKIWGQPIRNLAGNLAEGCRDVADAIIDLRSPTPAVKP